jgi:hypothetical protein
MRAAAPGVDLHFPAFEFTYYGDTGGDGPSLRNDYPLFWHAVTDPGDASPVVPDAVTLHFFGSRHATDLDSDLFTAARGFAADLGQLRVDAGAPVWVTENNVQSSTPDVHGNDTTGKPFQNDTRGTSAFFAAWRPFIFSLLGKAGNAALYHWAFTAGQCSPLRDGNCAMDADGGLLPLDLDTQQAEFGYTDGQPFLSYWVDMWLGRMFPPDPGATILPVSMPVALPDGGNDPGVEVLATQADDGTVTVMVVAIAPEPGANNGTGLPRTVLLDLDALPLFASASLLVIDGATPADRGPGEPVPIPVRRKMVVTLANGYGVAFLVLHPG